jgi:hypothetical protein
MAGPFPALVGCQRNMSHIVHLTGTPIQGSTMLNSQNRRLAAAAGCRWAVQITWAWEQCMLCQHMLGWAVFHTQHTDSSGAAPLTWVNPLPSNDRRMCWRRHAVVHKRHRLMLRGGTGESAEACLLHYASWLHLLAAHAAGLHDCCISQALAGRPAAVAQMRW